MTTINDTVKAPATDCIEDFGRWLNNIQSQLNTMPYRSKTKIQVKKITTINFVEVRRV